MIIFVRHILKLLTIQMSHIVHDKNSKKIFAMMHMSVSVTLTSVSLISLDYFVLIYGSMRAITKDVLDDLNKKIIIRIMVIPD